MAKLRATITCEVEYEADPSHYGTIDPQEMARIDQEFAEADPASYLDSVGAEWAILVEPVNDTKAKG